MKKAMIIALVCVFGLGLAAERTQTSGTFTVKEVAGFLYCALPCKGAFENMQQNIDLLMHAVYSQNIAPVGPMLGVFYNDPETTKPENLVWEIGFPVTETNVLDPLRLKPWTFTTVVEAVHTGPYEKSGAMYAEIMTWIEENGYVVNGPVMEKYLSDPDSTRPEALKTEIWVPVAKK